jgi:hypothetical protein
MQAIKFTLFQSHSTRWFRRLPIITIATKVKVGEWGHRSVHAAGCTCTDVVCTSTVGNSSSGIKVHFFPARTVRSDHVAAVAFRKIRSHFFPPFFVGWDYFFTPFFHWVQLSRTLPNTTQSWSVDMLLQIPDNGDEAWRNIDNAGIADMNNREVTSS